MDLLPSRIPLETGTEHIGWQGEWLLAKPRFVSNEFYESLSSGKIRKNDVLLVKDGATIGKIAIADLILSAIHPSIWYVRQNLALKVSTDVFFQRDVLNITKLTAFAMPTARVVLYGVQTMEGIRTSNDSFYEKECFFFGDSFSFRHKKLDGVVLHDERGTVLCLNPFSEHASDFRQTSLVKLFRKELELVDPKDLEASGECFIADCAFSRKDLNPVVRYLKKKYDLKSVTLTGFVPMNCPVK